MAKIDTSKMTVPALKRWSIKNKDLALSVASITAYAKVMRERVNEIQREVLEEIPMFTDCKVCREKGEPVTRIYEGDRLYRSGDDAGYARYLLESDKREREAGLKPSEMPRDHCPALVAEHAQCKAENILMDSAKTVTGIGSQDVWLERRTEYLRMLMGLALSKK